MTYSPAVPVSTSWRDSPFIRVAGAAASWLLFSLGFTLLVTASFELLALGGACASGGPYDISVECPDTVAAFAPGGVYIGLAGVAIAIFFSQGFGTPLIVWAWPILFGGLGGAFLWVFFVSGEPTGLIVGGVFELMAVVPLIIELRGSVQRVFLGANSAAGLRFAEGSRARRSMMTPSAPNPEGAVRPTILSWVLSLGITAVSIYLGYTLAVLWYLAS